MGLLGNEAPESGATSLTLEYDLYYRHYNGDDATVQVWDGSSWITVWADSNSNVQAHHSWDVTAYANADFKVKFSYQNAAYDWWFAVDNVTVVAEKPGASCPSSVTSPAFSRRSTNALRCLHRRAFSLPERC